MVDPALPAIAVATYLGKPYLEKLIGPTCDYLGNKLADVVKRRLDNLNKILEKANQLDINHTIEAPGSISPRILFELINGGSFIEDELTQAYFAGILLSSRNEKGTDDRGLYYIDIIKKASSLDLTLHFYLYLTFREQFLDSPDSLLLYTEREKLSVIIPSTKAMPLLTPSGFSSDLLPNEVSISLVRLKAEGLITQYAFSQDRNVVRKVYPKADEGGIAFSPSVLGTLLFLWALGIKNEEAHNLCSQRLEIEKRIEALGIIL